MDYVKEDQEIVKKLRKESPQFRNDEMEHERLSKALEKLNKRKNLLPEEELTVKKLHFDKLAVKDKLVSLIRQAKSGNSNR